MRAAAEDPIQLFSALPAVRVDAAETEAMIQAVHGLRRVHHLQSGSGGRSWRRWAALAAGLILASLLAPERALVDPSVSVPFSGALGVGLGRLELDAKSAPGPAARALGLVGGGIDYELAWGACCGRQDPDPQADGAERELLAKGTLEVPASGLVDQRIGAKYSIRFELIPLTGGARFGLRGFELARVEAAARETLARADLLLTTQRPLQLKLSDASSDGRLLSLVLRVATAGQSRPEGVG